MLLAIGGGQDRSASFEFREAFELARAGALVGDQNICHTGADHGIHMLPITLWRLQKLERADFIFSPDEEKTT